MEISLNKTSSVKGETVTMTLKHADIDHYEQVQVEIFDTKEPNPTSKLGFGTSPKQVADGYYEVVFNTNDLALGIYEIRHILLHTGKHKLDDKLFFNAGSDFNRTFFEVISANDKVKTSSEIKNEVINFEIENQIKFTEGIDISKTFKNSFTVFILVKRLLIGARYRFDKFEIIPLNRGLDTLDELCFTNSFLKDFTSFNLDFPYNETMALHSQSGNPVSVVYFPNIIADNPDDAKAFALTKTTFLLQAFSLTRGATGDVFDIVCIDLKSGNGTRYFFQKGYVGNLLTGNFSGENPQNLIKSIETLETDLFKRFGSLNIFVES
ncbi:hypothetical protein [Flectobacillus rivi]|uniref:DUF2141 domain-containing protein n=1 Tax=Flectobacillus rivi TaxID=2984209 RepID=A0ABT6Z324_9BACT|nr:hypothetical protein [Flectobacillus rivi]MDI9875049.1 hypothetical protein [Flectobacillus rivi]